MKKIFPSVTVLAAMATCLLGCSSCAQLDRKDISGESSFQRLVGKKVMTKKEVWAQGISNESPAQKHVDVVELTSQKLARTRFVVSMECLNAGAVLEIVKILDTPNWFVKMVEGRRIQYVVRIINPKQKNDLPTEINSLDITGNPDDATYGLNPEVYEVVPLATAAPTQGK